ncbi:hypothetical protein GEMRC1_012171 [Eukaryota sp. GEM-RC1]
MSFGSTLCSFLSKTLLLLAEIFISPCFHCIHFSLHQRHRYLYFIPFSLLPLFSSSTKDAFSADVSDSSLAELSIFLSHSVSSKENIYFADC